MSRVDRPDNVFFYSPVLRHLTYNDSDVLSGGLVVLAYTTRPFPAKYSLNASPHNSPFLSPGNLGTKTASAVTIGSSYRKNLVNDLRLTGWDPRPAMTIIIIRIVQQ